jgi:hypothetical protein
LRQHNRPKVSHRFGGARTSVNRKHLLLRSNIDQSYLTPSDSVPSLASLASAQALANACLRRLNSPHRLLCLAASTSFPYSRSPASGRGLGEGFDGVEQTDGLVPQDMAQERVGVQVDHCWPVLGWSVAEVSGVRRYPDGSLVFIVIPVVNYLLKRPSPADVEQAEDGRTLGACALSARTLPASIQSPVP